MQQSLGSGGPTEHGVPDFAREADSAVRVPVHFTAAAAQPSADADEDRDVPIQIHAPSVVTLEQWQGIQRTLGDDRAGGDDEELAQLPLNCLDSSAMRVPARRWHSAPPLGAGKTMISHFYCRSPRSVAPSKNEIEYRTPSKNEIEDLTPRSPDPAPIPPPVDSDDSMPVAKFEIRKHGPLSEDQMRKIEHAKRIICNSTPRLPRKGCMKRNTSKRGLMKKLAEKFHGELGITTMQAQKSLSYFKNFSPTGHEFLPTLRAIKMANLILNSYNN